MTQDSTSTTVVRVSVNGEDEQFAVSSGETLMETFRGTGHYDVKNGCDEGVCGACSVILGGEGITRPCLVPAASCDGAEVTTVEGSADDDGDLHLLQPVFLERGAAQCSYCIPGVLLASYDLPQRNDEPTESEVADGLSGNICRCTGYVQQIEVVQAAAGRLSGSDALSEGSG